MSNKFSAQVKHVLPVGIDGKNDFISRRSFLSLLMASAGSAALAACGGGSAGDGSSGSVANVATGVSKAASASGTVIPPASSITDNSGNVWTLVSGHVTRNGSSVTTGSSVALVAILYFNGTIYAKNSSGIWFKSGSPWTNIGSADPRGTTATNAVANNSLFYGINGHMAWGSGSIYNTMSAASQLAILKDLGVTNYRADVCTAAMAQILANALNGPFKDNGVSILPVLNPPSIGWNVSLSESAAYTLGYNLATSVTKVLKGLVKYIECGNELDVNARSNGNGNLTSNWDPKAWGSFRGVIRGMVDGVRAIDPTIKVGVGVGIPLAFRALQMLWNGITPDGSANGVSGAATIRWDFTCYHWYESSGDVVCGWINNQCFDVLQSLKDAFGVPIWLTEWGWHGQTDTPDQQVAYVNKALAEYKSVKDKYNLQSVMMYAVIDDRFGLVKNDGVTKTPAYNTFKNFVKANPV
ncbi:glycosyl hydrolase [Caballeronia sp. SL2Y3]|uniref:glycosyl hydrolase n=1 Tax=Caballeronia sp. SL2Y3 TaxID=2878151 RepID=UPI001FD360C7|nr:glycosyl hydrolase [Caballeronia sp. SL2Y3]